MSDINLLKNVPPSDLYGDEDGFDMEIELKPEITEEDELNYYWHQVYMVMEQDNRVNSTEAGYPYSDWCPPSERFVQAPPDNWF